MRRLVPFVLACWTAVALTGCSGSPDEPKLTVTGAYMPQPPMADMAAGYLTIVNSGGAADTLTGVTSDVAAEVTMHSTTDAGQMKAVTAFPIPAHGRLTFRVGANHLMLGGLKRLPQAGETVEFVLRFAKSAQIVVHAPVKPAGGTDQGM
jgi:copper(I)-binding protein